ncbi:hypothetical protein Sjap_002642 [Stephania japonica]|uniref:Uncharacterized protein n=1 Tax=Stephania japonica TaxID=461633 RepID=A0AAP0KPD7_9MAGN
MTPAWMPLLCKHAHYEESQLRPLMVTYEKYAHPEHSHVAEITPIEKLPQ